MTNLLIRAFVKETDNSSAADLRESYGKLSGWVGMTSNILLFFIKLATGLFTGNISITADSVNNLSDSASSLVTFAAFKLSGMPADEEHPYGHARFEYIGGMVISCIILGIGAQCFLSSLQKTLNPSPVSFSFIVGLLLIISIVIKLWQGGFYKNIGMRISSGTLIAAATDSRNDVISTSAVLLSATLSHYLGLDLDGPMGMLVALFVIFSGARILKDAISPLLGPAPERELVEGIAKKILSYPSVIGLHDLIIHNYGPGRCFASVHVELPASQDIMLSHDIIDRIEKDFLIEQGLNMVIHLDPVVTDDARTGALRELVVEIARWIDPVLSVHDFRMVEGQSHTNLIFDVTTPPRYPLTDRALRTIFGQKTAEADPSFYTVITIDRSFTSTASPRPDPKKKRGL